MVSAVHGPTAGGWSDALCSEGVGAVRRMVGTWDLVAGVVNGDDERTRTVSVVVRDNNDNGMS